MPQAITGIKIRYAENDGYSDTIPFSINTENLKYKGKTLTEIFGSDLKLNTPIQTQINNLESAKANKTSAIISDTVLYGPNLRWAVGTNTDDTSGYPYAQIMKSSNSMEKVLCILGRWEAGNSGAQQVELVRADGKVGISRKYNGYHYNPHFYWGFKNNTDATKSPYIFIYPSNTNGNDYHISISVRDENGNHITDKAIVNSEGVFLPDFAKKSHTSSTTEYGGATQDLYGHAKVINNLTTSSHTAGNALSAYQGYVLKQAVDSKVTDSGIFHNGALYWGIGSNSDATKGPRAQICRSGATNASLVLISRASDNTYKNTQLIDSDGNILPAFARKSVSSKDSSSDAYSLTTYGISVHHRRVGGMVQLNIVADNGLTNPIQVSSANELKLIGYLSETKYYPYAPYVEYHEINLDYSIQLKIDTDGKIYVGYFKQHGASSQVLNLPTGTVFRIRISYIGIEI